MDGLIDLQSLPSRYDGPPDISLKIESSERSFKYYLTLGHPHPRHGNQLAPLSARINWSLDDLGNRYNKLTQLLEPITHETPYSGAHKLIAEHGSGYFLEIFRKEDHRHYILEYLKDAFSNNNRVVHIHIVSRDFYFPWSFLYMVPFDHSSYDPKNFLGYRAVITQHLPSDKDNDVSHMPPYLLDALTPRVQLGYCSAYPNVKKYEVAYFDSLRESNAIFLKKIKRLNDDLNPSDFGDSYKKHFCACLSSNEFDVIHLACHASTGSDTSERRIRVRKSFYISQLDLINGKMHMESRPILFLNACEMGVVDPQSHTNFLQFFWDEGARAIIAPMCRVGDLRASLFAKEFYNYFISKRYSIRTAYRKACNARIKKGDITPLVYTIFGQSGASFTRGNGNGKSKSA